MLFKFFIFSSFILFYSLPICATENTFEMGYEEPVPWTDFTYFEIELATKLTEYFYQGSSFQNFECYYESVEQDVIGNLTDIYYDHMETLKPNPPQLNFYRQEIWKLEKRLRLDVTHLVDITCALIENDGIINNKIKKQFFYWSRDTLRMSTPLFRLSPQLNKEKTLKFLESRLFELYYFIQTLVLYKKDPSPKHANELNMHLEEILNLKYPE